MKKYAICNQSLVPVRKTPSEKSEMVNQIIFGELLIVEDEQDSWLLVKTNHDMYEGWVDLKQIHFLSTKEYENINNTTPVFQTDIYANAKSNEGVEKHIVMGSRLPNYSNGTFSIADRLYNFNGNTSINIQQLPKNEIINIASNYIGTPYLWGGRSPFGIDCSGFTQIVFAIIGIKLKRDASQQVEMGKTIDFISEAQVGDLAFFDNEEEKITHVGIFINNKQLIHASGEVKIDDIDHNGIYNRSKKKYTHKLRIIKRVF